MNTQQKAEIKFTGADAERSYTLKDLRNAKVSLDEVIKLGKTGQSQKALSKCAALVKNFPRYFSAVYTLGQLYEETGNFALARQNYSEAALIYPTSWRAHMGLASIYFKLEAFAAAKQRALTALALSPNNIDVVTVLVRASYMNNEFADAESYALQMHRLDPKSIEGQNLLFRSAVHLGKLEDYADQINATLVSEGATPWIINICSQLPTNMLTDAAKKILHKTTTQIINPDLSIDDQIRWEFSQVSVLEGMGKFKDAWGAAKKANNLVLKSRDLSPRSEIEKVDTAINNASKISEETLKKAAENEDEPVPLFILGPTRSGKTTLEKIIARHPKTIMGSENALLNEATLACFNEFGAFPTPKIEHIPVQAWRGFTRIYNDLVRLRHQNSDVFTSTSPGYLTKLPYIYRLLSNSKFVFVKRDRYDQISRIYFKHYREGNHISYDIRTIVEYLSKTELLMDTLAERLPNAVKVVNYEDCVSSPEKLYAEIMRFCGIKPGPVNIGELPSGIGCGEPYREEIDKVLKGEFLH